MLGAILEPMCVWQFGQVRERENENPLHIWKTRRSTKKAWMQLSKKYSQSVHAYLWEKEVKKHDGKMCRLTDQPSMAYFHRFPT
jgi:hypothetical protein